jgi:hypothetical protein
MLCNVVVRTVTKMMNLADALQESLHSNVEFECVCRPGEKHIAKQVTKLQGNMQSGVSSVDCQNVQITSVCV